MPRDVRRAGLFLPPWMLTAISALTVTALVVSFVLGFILGRWTGH
jgi:hypothetical protein